MPDLRVIVMIRNVEDVDEDAVYRFFMEAVDDIPTDTIGAIHDGQDVTVEAA
jgi:hypothetical protein